MNEEPLNLRASLQAIWRRRIFIIVVAVVCGLAGVTYGLLRPAKQSAVALILLPASAATGSGNSGNTGNSGATAGNIDTEAVIARSAPVLAAAGAKVSPPLGALAVKKLVTVTPLSGQILQVEAQGQDSDDAINLANAVAASYVDEVRQMNADTTKTAVAGLQHEVTGLSEQIKNLQYEIATLTARIPSEGAGSAQGQLDTNQVSSLQNELSQDSLQLNNVTNQIANAPVEGSSTSTARILQMAAAQPTSKYGFPIEAGVIGFVLGAIGSALFVLVRLQNGHRLRFRDEIARTAGAPVIASLDAPSCTTVSAWQSLLAGRQRATTEWSLQHVLRCLPINNRLQRSIRVISVAGDTPALATGPRLAQHAAASGISTVLVPEVPSTSEDRALKALRAAYTSVELVDRGLSFSVGLNGTDQDPPELVVSLLVFQPDSTILTPSDAVNLLSISANVVTDEELALLALQVSDGGLVLDGVVVVNPDPSDNTTGLSRNDMIGRLPARAGADGDHELIVHLGGSITEAGAGQGQRSYGGA